MSAAASWVDGWTVGEMVCVHGEGFGKIEKLVDRDMNPYAVVAIRRRGVHPRGHGVIEWTERVTVSLDVYPPHMTRQAS